MTPSADQWRGLADDDVDDNVGLGSVSLLRSRSRALLRSLLAPHRRAFEVASTLLVAETAARLAGPYLLKLGIDRGIPPLAAGGAPTVLLAVVGVVGVVLVVCHRLHGLA